MKEADNDGVRAKLESRGKQDLADYIDKTYDQRDKGNADIVQKEQAWVCPECSASNNEDDKQCHVCFYDRLRNSGASNASHMSNKQQQNVPTKVSEGQNQLEKYIGEMHK